VYTGFTSARKEWIFFTDSDKQFNVAEISRLLPFMGEAELIAGYRAPRRDPFQRVLFGKAWSALVTVLFGYTVRDVDCAFKLFRRRSSSGSRSSLAAPRSAPSSWCGQSARGTASERWR